MIVNLLLGLVCGVIYWMVLDDRVGRWRGYTAFIAATLVAHFVHLAFP